MQDLDTQIYFKVNELLSQHFKQDFEYRKVAGYHICYSEDYVLKFELNSLNSEQKTDASVLLKIESSLNKHSLSPNKEYLYNGISFDLIENEYKDIIP